MPPLSQGIKGLRPIFCVIVFHAKAQVSDGSCTRAVRPETLLLGAEKFNTFDVLSGQYDNACGQEFVYRVGWCDGPIFVQRGRVSFFVKEDGMAVDPCGGGDTRDG